MLGTHGLLRRRHLPSPSPPTTNHACDVSFNITIHQDTCNAAEDKSSSLWFLLADQIHFGSLKFNSQHFHLSQLPVSFIQAEVKSIPASAAMQ